MSAAEAESPLPERFGDDPSWFPFWWEAASDRLLLVRLDEGALRAASFLDQRALFPDAARRQVPWAAAAQAASEEGARRDVQYIFHIGHVGSTLLSRLLGELPGVLSLREPLILRGLADAIGAGLWTADEQARRVHPVTALLSRTFRREQRALVKATSFTSEIADRLVPPGSKALFLTVRPRAYIETILGGDASRQELAMLTPSRIQRLARRCPGLAPTAERMTEAQKAALAWACESTSLARSGAAIGAERIRWIDFDDFLAAPAAGLASAAAFLGHPAAPGEAEALCAGPLMRRYSKALEYEYSPGLRQEVLSDARRRFGRDIDAALSWLQALGARYPAVAGALDRG